MSNGKARLWFGEEDQLRLIRWFGTREQVIGFTVAVILYIAMLSVIWFDPFDWHLFHFFRLAHAALSAFAIFAAIVFAPLMAYLTLESELLNRLLIMKAERSEATQLAQDEAIFQLLTNSADANEASQTMLTGVSSLLTDMRTVLTTMQRYDRDDAKDLDEVVAFIRALGPDLPQTVADIRATQEILLTHIAQLQRWEGDR